MLRRDFLTTIGVGVIRPSIFIPRPDFPYEDVLKEIFDKTIEKAELEKTYDEHGYVVAFEIGDDPNKSLYRSHVLDENNNSEFEYYEDYGYLKNILYLPKNGKTSIDYAEISLGKQLGVHTTEIYMELKTDRFKKIKKKGLFSFLHDLDTYDKYAMGGKLEGFDIKTKRGRDIPLDPNNRILLLYGTFAQHFKVNPRFPNNFIKFI